MISEFVATQQNRLDVEANHAHTHESVDARWVVIAAGGLEHGWIMTFHILYIFKGSRPCRQPQKKKKSRTLNH